jgi:hypothetical protein
MPAAQGTLSSKPHRHRAPIFSARAEKVGFANRAEFAFVASGDRKSGLPAQSVGTNENVQNGLVLFQTKE